MTDESTESVELEGVLAKLRSHGTRIRTCIVLIDPKEIPRSPEVATIFSLDSVDYAKALLEGQPEGSDLVPVSAASEEQRLIELTNRTWSSDGLLIHNIDLAIAGMELPARATFWANVFRNFPPSRTAILLVMPAGARHLLPPDHDYHRWSESGRLGTHIF